MVQGKIIKRLLGHPTTTHPSDPTSPYDTRPSRDFAARPAFNRETTFNLNSPLTCVDISPAGTHAIVAGDKVFKTLEVNGSSITEGADLRAALRNPGDGIGTAMGGGSDQLKIGHVRWSHGELDSTIVTAATNGRIVTHDLNGLSSGSGIEVGRIREHQRQVHKLAINPFLGNLLLTGSQDGTVRFFDIKAPEGRTGLTFINRAIFKCNQDPVRDVKWSPNKGFEFACSTGSGTLQHWDTRNQKSPLLKINAHNGACLTVSWHPDGEHIVSGGLDHRCFVWDLSRDAAKRQKPKYSFATPAPVSIVSWRPAFWSGSSQALRAAQIVTVYDGTNSLKTQNPTINVWDVARPGLPFKEITSHESSPTGMQWQNTDVLWTVSREGIFRQNDLSYAPKVIDRRPLSTFSLSPQGEVAMIVEERQTNVKHPHRESSAITIEKPIRSRLSMTSSIPNGQLGLGMSRSDSEEDTSGSFLGPPAKTKKSKKRNNMRAGIPLSSTPPSASDISILRLEDSVKLVGQWKPGQTMAIGPAPSALGKGLFAFLSTSYLMAITQDLRESETQTYEKRPVHVRLGDILSGFAETSEKVGQYRLAQTWKLLAYTMSLMLIRRAHYHREQRLRRVSDRKLKQDRLEKQHIQNSQRLEHLQFIHDRTPTKPPRQKPIREQKSGTVKGGSIAKLHEESTSTMTTPLARPVNDSSEQIGQPLIHLNNEDFKLPASLLSDNQNVLSVPPHPPTPSTQHSPLPLLPLPPLSSPLSDGGGTPKSPSPIRPHNPVKPQANPVPCQRRSPTRSINNGHGSHASLEGGYDFYDLEALHGASTHAIDIAPQHQPPMMRAPLRLDMPILAPTESVSTQQDDAADGMEPRPGRVLRHDSSESFSMFSTGGESPYTEAPNSMSPPRSMPKTHEALFAERHKRETRDQGKSTESEARNSTHSDESQPQSQGQSQARSFNNNTETFSLQSSDYDSSWDSSGVNDMRQRIGYDSMDSETPDDLIQPVIRPPLQNHQQLHKNPAFGSQSIIHNPYFARPTSRHGNAPPPRSVPAGADGAGGAGGADDGDASNARDSKLSTHSHAVADDFDDDPDSDADYPLQSGAMTPNAIDESESSHEILDIDYLPHPEDPNFIPSPIDPHLLVPRQLDFSVQTSSLSASMLILVLSPHLKPDTLDATLNAAVLAQYHHRLTTNELFNEAAMLRKLCYPNYPTVFNQGRAVRAGEVGYACETEGCKGRLKKEGIRVGEVVKRCERCRGHLAGCTVCGGVEVPQSEVGVSDGKEYSSARVWVICQGCGHGGHERCLTEWFKSCAGRMGEDSDDEDEDEDGAAVNEGVCPLGGCLHPCLPGSWRRGHQADVAARNAAVLTRTVRSELDVRSIASFGSRESGGRRSRRGSLDRGLASLSKRLEDERDGGRVIEDRQKTAPSRAVDALRLEGRDPYREQVEGRGNERRKSVKIVAPGE